MNRKNSKTKTGAASPQTGQLKLYFKQSHNLLNSLVLVMPLLILYQVGLLVNRFKGVNGVDFVSQILVPIAGPVVIVVLNFVLLALLFLGLWHLRKKQKFDSSFLGPMLVESIIYAFFLGAIIVFVIRYAFPIADSQDLGQADWITKVTISLGAGVYEELFFRLILISLLTHVFFKGIKVHKASAIFGAFLISSLLFSLAHYATGPIDAYGFTYRFLAGLIFAALFKFRSFAIAVYTHAFYDMFVLFSR
jgi:membrane protease YdiL (CAAX protease family)